MIIRCPSCGAENSLDTVVEDDAAARALNCALELSAVGRPLVRYLALFRPAKRRLTWPRVTALLGELLPAIKAERIERDGRVHDAPLAVWASAIEKTLQARDAGTLRTPLKSHGYLFEIAIAEAARGNALVVREQIGGPARATSAVAKAVDTLNQRKRGNDERA
jgi:hypothetical protein